MRSHILPTTHHDKAASEGNAQTASISLEAAIVIPVMFMVLMFFVRLIQCLCAQNCVERAVTRTGELMSRYAILYHEFGLSQLENKALTELGGIIGDSLGEETAGIVLGRFIDLRACAETGDDLLYTAVAEEIFKYYLEQDKLVSGGYIDVDNVSMKGSEFFNRDDDIELYVRCRVCNMLYVGSSMRTSAWIRGDNPMASLDESGISVWTLNNFARGKIIRQLFGGNLPYDYPTVSAFNDGEVVMIKSIDTTKATYQNTKALNREITAMINKLAAFRGTEDVKGIEEQYVIRESDITSRKLLIVMPTNETPVEISGEIVRLTVQAVLKDVKLEIVMYHESG